MSTKAIKGGRAPKCHRIPKHLGKAMRRIASAQVQRDAPARELYELGMTFTMEGVRSYIEAAIRDYKIPAGDFTPEFIAVGAYDEQDLIIALKMQLIDTPESWTVGIDSHFYNEQTGGVHTIPFFVELPAISFAQLMTAGGISVTRAGGIPTRWKGLDRELTDHWDEQGVPPGYKIFKSEIKLEAVAKFVSPQAYRDYLGLLKIRATGPGELIKYLYESWRRGA